MKFSRYIRVTRVSAQFVKITVLSSLISSCLSNCMSDVVATEVSFAYEVRTYVFSD